MAHILLTILHPSWCNKIGNCVIEYFLLWVVYFPNLEHVLHKCVLFLYVYNFVSVGPQIDFLLCISRWWFSIITNLLKWDDGGGWRASGLFSRSPWQFGWECYLLLEDIFGFRRPIQMDKPLDSGAMQLGMQNSSLWRRVKVCSL